MSGVRAIGALSIGLALATGIGLSAGGDDSQRLLTIDHYRSGRVHRAGDRRTDRADLRARARARRRGAARSARSPIASSLFVHGAGTPAEVAFDVPYQDYSWMAYLARAGFDVFAMDTTGYGRSTRPAPMNDPCNLAKDRQAPFVIGRRARRAIRIS